MSDFSHFHATHPFPHPRLPRAGVDRIDTGAFAWALIDTLIERPLTDETIVVILDHDHRGRSVFCVNGTVDRDAMLDVLDALVRVDEGDIGAVVVASVRPPVPGVADVDDRDVERWIEASEMAAAGGIELLEWFVVGRAVTLPRDHLCEPPRWAS